MVVGQCFGAPTVVTVARTYEKVTRPMIPPPREISRGLWPGLCETRRWQRISDRRLRDRENHDALSGAQTNVTFREWDRDHRRQGAFRDGAIAISGISRLRYFSLVSP